MCVSTVEVGRLSNLVIVHIFPYGVVHDLKDVRSSTRQSMLERRSSPSVTGQKLPTVLQLRRAQGQQVCANIGGLDECWNNVCRGYLLHILLYRRVNKPPVQTSNGRRKFHR